MASVIAEVRGSILLRTRKMPIFELTLGQGRLALKCIWFNASYLEGKFLAGQTVAVFGKVEPSRSSQNFKMIQPQFEVLPDASDDAETRLLEVGRITPVYESLGGAGWPHAGSARPSSTCWKRCAAQCLNAFPRDAGATRPAGSRDRIARSSFSARRHSHGAVASLRYSISPAADL